jgi:hypothetical protein
MAMARLYAYSPYDVNLAAANVGISPTRTTMAAERKSISIHWITADTVANTAKTAETTIMPMVAGTSVPPPVAFSP